MNLSGSPVANTDLFDIIGIRHDGGIDTVVACGGYLDSSADTLSRLTLKVRGYLRAIASDGFADLYGKGSVCIFVSCSQGASAEAQEVVDALAREAADQNVHLSLGDPVT